MLWASLRTLYGHWRAFWIPRRIARKSLSLLAEADRNAHYAHARRKEETKALADDVAYWKIEAQEKQKELEQSRLAHKLALEELAAARVQIDQSAKIINKHNQQELAEAMIAAIKTRGQVNDDALRTLLNHGSRDD